MSGLSHLIALLTFIEFLLQQVVAGALRKIIDFMAALFIRMGDSSEDLLVAYFNLMLVGRVWICLTYGHVDQVVLITDLDAPIVKSLLRA